MEYHTPPGLVQLIWQLRELNILEHDDKSNIKNVSSILKSWVSRSDWLEEKYYQVDREKGYSSWLIFEEADHSLAVNLIAWEPEREIRPHDHRTWAVVGSVIGVEQNYFWTRLDDGTKPGYADIERRNPAILCHPGHIITFEATDIHSVNNGSKSVAISLHVYGKNLNYTNRLQYNPITKTAVPFIVDFS